MNMSGKNRWFLSATLLFVLAASGCSNEGPPRVIETDPEDILNPQAFLLGSTTLSGPGFGLFVSDYIAYIYAAEADGTSSLSLFDITDIEFPLFLNKYSGLDGGIHVVAEGQFESAGTTLPELSSKLYLPILSKGLQTLDVSDAFDIKDAGITPTTATGSVIDFSPSSSETFFCFANSENLMILNTPPGGGFWVGLVTSTEFVSAVSSDIDYCYFVELLNAGTSPSQLHIIDPGSASSPVEVGAVDVEGTELTVIGNYAYVLKEDTGFSIVDISNPASPILISQVNIPTAKAFNSMSVNDVLKRVYVSTDTGVSITDISDPFFPVDLGGFELVDTPTAIFANSGILYVTTADATLFNPSQLLVIDVSQF